MQLALHAVKWEHYEYHLCLGIHEQRCGVIETFLRIARSRMVDNSFFVNSVCDFPRQDKACNVYACFLPILTAARERRAAFRSATSNVPQTQSLKISRDVSFIFTHLDGCQADWRQSLGSQRITIPYVLLMPHFPHTVVYSVMCVN